MIDLKKIRDLLKENHYQDAINGLNRFEQYKDELDSFEGILNDIKKKERTGVYSPSEASKEYNILRSNIFDLLSTIQNNSKENTENKIEKKSKINNRIIQPQKKPITAEIKEIHIKKLENHLTMKNYKASHSGDNSYLKSYYFLLKIQDTVIGLIEKIEDSNMNASYSINEIIGESASLRTDIKEWLKALSVTKFDNSVLFDLVDEIDERCLEIQAERATTITTASRPQRILISKIGSLETSLRLVKEELELWIGQAEKYRLN